MVSCNSSLCFMFLQHEIFSNIQQPVCTEHRVFQDILVVNRTISHVELSELQQYLPWLAAQSHILWFYCQVLLRNIPFIPGKYDSAQPDSSPSHMREDEEPPPHTSINTSAWCCCQLGVDSEPLPAASCFLLKTTITPRQASQAAPEIAALPSHQHLLSDAVIIG